MIQQMMLAGHMNNITHFAGQAILDPTNITTKCLEVIVVVDQPPIAAVRRPTMECVCRMHFGHAQRFGQILFELLGGEQRTDLAFQQMRRAGVRGVDEWTGNFGVGAVHHRLAQTGHAELV